MALRLAEATAASGGLYVLGTRAGASTTSCEAAPDGKATWARAGSSSASKTPSSGGMGCRHDRRTRDDWPRRRTSSATPRRDGRSSGPRESSRGSASKSACTSQVLPLVEQQRRQLQALRAALLSMGAATAWLEERDPALLSRLRAGAARDLEGRLRRVLLSRLDAGWAYHLARVSEIKEGVYLHSVGGRGALSFKIEPIDAFHGPTSRAFAELGEALDATTLDVLVLAGSGAAVVCLTRGRPWRAPTRW